MPTIGEWADMAGQTKAPQQIAAVSTFLPLALAAVALRIWIRTRMIRNFGWDDGMMIVALVNFTMYCTALMVIVANGGGTHIQTVVEMRVGINWTLVAEVFYLTTILFLKISLGLFFLRVVQKPWQRKVVYATVFLSTVIQTYHTIFIIFSCGNPTLYLEHMLLRKCVSKRIELGLAYEQAAITTATDFVFALLPIPLLWNATMDRRSKISVGFVLGLGAMGSVCSIVRFKYIDGLGSHDDFFWNAANVSIWSTIEMATGIIAGCLATMRPLFKKIVYRARHLTHAATHNQTSQNRILGRKKTETTTLNRSQKTFNEWKKTVDSQTYTTTCIGGPDLESAEALADMEVKGASLIQIREEKIYPKEIWSQDPDTSRIWPFANDREISKVVNIEVRVSHEGPWNGGSSGGLWGKKMEELIQTPPRARKGSKDSNTPEWDKLPDLIPPSRAGSESETTRHKRSKSKESDDRPEWDRLPDLVLPESARAQLARTKSRSPTPPLVRISSR